MKILALLPILFFAVFIAAVIWVIIFWIRMLIDAIKRDFPKTEDKIIWVLIILFLHLIGAIIYCVMVKRKKSNQTIGSAR